MCDDETHTSRKNWKEVRAERIERRTMPETESSWKEDSTPARRCAGLLRRGCGGCLLLCAQASVGRRSAGPVPGAGLSLDQRAGAELRLAGAAGAEVECDHGTLPRTRELQTDGEAAVTRRSLAETHPEPLEVGHGIGSLALLGRGPDRERLARPVTTRQTLLGHTDLIAIAVGVLLAVDRRRRRGGWRRGELTALQHQVADLRLGAIACLVAETGNIAADAHRHIALTADAAVHIVVAGRRRRRGHVLVHATIAILIDIVARALGGMGADTGKAVVAVALVRGAAIGVQVLITGGQVAEPVGQVVEIDLSNPVLVAVDVAAIAEAIAVEVGLVGIEDVDAVVVFVEDVVAVAIVTAGIAHTVTIGVDLATVGHQRTVVLTVEHGVTVVVIVAGVTQAIAIGVELIGVGHLGTVVRIEDLIAVVVDIAGGAEAVAVLIFLARVGHQRTVVILVGHAVAVVVALAGIADAVTVGVELIVVGHERTVVIVIVQVVIVIVLVAGVALAVVVGIGLDVVEDLGAVVVLVDHAVVVVVDVAGAADAVTDEDSVEEDLLSIGLDEADQQHPAIRADHTKDGGVALLPRETDHGAGRAVVAGLAGHHVGVAFPDRLVSGVEGPRAAVLADGQPVGGEALLRHVGRGGGGGDRLRAGLGLVDVARPQSQETGKAQKGQHTMIHGFFSP